MPDVSGIIQRCESADDRRASLRDLVWCDAIRRRGRDD